MQNCAGTVVFFDETILSYKFDEEFWTFTCISDVCLNGGCGV